MPHNFWHGTKRRFKIPLQQISFIKNTEHNLSHLKLINAYNPPHYKSSIKRCKHDEFDRMALAHKTQLFTIQWYSKIPPKFFTITNVYWQYELKSYIIKWREKWLVFFIAQQIFFTGKKNWKYSQPWEVFLSYKHELICLFWGFFSSILQYLTTIMTLF